MGIGNKEIARFLYETQIILIIFDILFNEFENIEYLIKCGFGKVHKAEWIGHVDVVLKGLYNSGNNILDILREVKYDEWNLMHIYTFFLVENI